MIYSGNSGIQQFFVDDNGYTNLYEFIEAANREMERYGVFVKPMVWKIESLENFKYVTTLNICLN